MLRIDPETGVIVIVDPPRRAVVFYFEPPCPRCRLRHVHVEDSNIAGRPDHRLERTKPCRQCGRQARYF